MVDTAGSWAAMADEKLRGTDVLVYGMAGNDDEEDVDAALHSEHLINVESTVTRVGEYQMLSCAWAIPLPGTPRVSCQKTSSWASWRSLQAAWRPAFRPSSTYIFPHSIRDWTRVPKSLGLTRRAWLSSRRWVVSLSRHLSEATPCGPLLEQTPTHSWAAQPHPRVAWRVSYRKNPLH